MQVVRRTLAVVLSAALAVTAASVIGCAANGIAYVDTGATYTLDEAEAMAHQINKPEFAGEAVSAAETLRQTQLTSLRSEGGQAAELASLLTDLFPDDQRSVPYHAEAATVDENPAWIVVEVWGPEGGNLDNSRVWVLERGTGRIILSATFD